MGGGGGNAAQAASDQEAARQKGIQQSVAQINSIYDSPERQQQYTDFGKAQQAYNLYQLNQQNTIANRNLNFSMARSGLTGSSADADAAAMQEQEYNTADLKGQQQALASAAALKQEDQQSKSSLIGLAESGLDATSASVQGLDSLRANIQNAQAQGQASDIGTAFSGLGSYFANSEKAKQLQQMQVNPYTYGLYGQQTPYAGAGAIASGGGMNQQNYLSPQPQY